MLGNRPLYLRILLLGMLVLGILLLGFASLVLTWPWLENRLLFWPDNSAFKRQPLTALNRAPFKARVQDVYFLTPDGQRLNAWFVPPIEHTGKQRPTIVFAHGNSGNLGDRWAVMQPFINKGYGFLAFDYRGYGNSTGQPSEHGLYTDFKASSQYLSQVYGILPSQQIAMGGSLGGAVVLAVALEQQQAQAPFKAVVVFSSFTSAPDVLREQLRQHGLGLLAQLPIETFWQQHFDALAKADQIQSPLLLAHSQNDWLTPARMSQQLYQQAKSPCKRLLIVKQGGHAVSSQVLLSELEKMLDPKKQPKACLAASF